MAALRRKKGSLIVALLSFISILAFVFIGITFSLYKDVNVTLIDFIFRTTGQWTTDLFKYNFDMFKDIDFGSLNYVYVVVTFGPLLTTLISIFLKRFRFINTINFIVLLLSFVSLNIVFVTDSNLIKESFSLFSNYGIATISCLGFSTILSYINLQLCR